MSSLLYSSSNSSISNRTQQTQERSISPSASSNEEEKLLKNQNIFRGIKEKKENPSKAEIILNNNPQSATQQLLTAEHRVPSDVDLMSFLKQTNNPTIITSRLNPHAEPFIPASQRGNNLKN